MLRRKGPAKGFPELNNWSSSSIPHPADPNTSPSEPSYWRFRALYHPHRLAAQRRAARRAADIASQTLNLAMQGQRGWWLISPTKARMRSEAAGWSMAMKFVLRVYWCWANVIVCVLFLFAVQLQVAALASRCDVKSIQFTVCVMCIFLWVKMSWIPCFDDLRCGEVGKENHSSAGCSVLPFNWKIKSNECLIPIRRCSLPRPAGQLAK